MQKDLKKQGNASVLLCMVLGDAMEKKKKKLLSSGAITLTQKVVLLQLWVICLIKYWDPLRKTKGT